METAVNATDREPWNKGKIVGQKAPFKPIIARSSALPLRRPK
jgi:hypothetical protein